MKSICFFIRMPYMWAWAFSRCWLLSIVYLGGLWYSSGGCIGTSLTWVLWWGNPSKVFIPSVLEKLSSILLDVIVFVMRSTAKTLLEFGFVRFWFKLLYSEEGSTSWVPRSLLFRWLLREPYCSKNYLWMVSSLWRFLNCLDFYSIISLDKCD